MDRETAVLALAVVTMLSVLAAVYPVIPVHSEQFSELGVLGPSQKIGGYPTSVAVGEQFSLYVYVGNHEGAPEYYQVLVKEGTASTVVNNRTSADLPPVLTDSLVLAEGSNTTIPVTISMASAGLNQRLIFELWMLNSTSGTFAYTGLWGQLFMNVSAA